MKVKIFDCNWSVELPKIEKEINAFLAELKPGAVKFVQTSMSSTRTDENDQMESDYVFTVWYED